MTLPLIITLLSSSLCSLSSSVPRPFHVEKEHQKTWAEAQQYCREKFTVLATIEDMTEMEKVKSLIQKEGVESAWIGLRKGSSSKWQWSLADRDFYRGNEAEFRNWGPGQPSSLPAGQDNDVNCVRMKREGEGKGRWFAGPCSHTHPFICYDGGDSTHPYVLVTENRTWADAQRYCRKNHTDLASVRNQEENKQIDAVKGNRDVWIGLFRDDWEWSDSSSSSFRYWYAGEPNNLDKELCTEIREDGEWNNMNCTLKRNFICYEDNLVLVHENKTWNEALQYCREHHVDLVSVRSERIQHWVQMLVRNASTAHVWLGLRHVCGVGWFWVWGETLCYDNWATGQEHVQDCTERVGAVKSGGDWGQEEGQWVSNLTDTERLNFICTDEDD